VLARASRALYPHAMSESVDMPSSFAKRPPRAPWLTMGLNLALILTIFLTRERWADSWSAPEEVAPGSRITAVFRGPPSSGLFVFRGFQHFVVWSPREGVAAKYTQQNRGLGDAIFSPDGSRILLLGGPAGAFDKPEGLDVRSSTPLMLDGETGRASFVLKGHGWCVDRVAFTPDSLRLVTIGSPGSGEGFLWDLASGCRLTRLRPPLPYSHDVAFSAHGDRIAVACDDFTIRVWDAANGAMLSEFPRPDPEPDSASKDVGAKAAFVADDCRLLEYHKHNTVVLSDTDSGRRDLVLGNISAFATSSKGTLLATSRWGEARIRLWNTASAATVATFSLRDRDVRQLLFSPDGTRLLACTKYSVSLFDTTCPPSFLARFIFESGFGGGKASFFPDNRRVLVQDNARVLVLDADTGSQLAEVDTEARTDRCDVLNNDTIALFSGYPVVTGFVCRRIRPEEWWGVFCLWHFWLIVALGAALVWSGWRDIRRMERRASRARREVGEVG